MLAQQNFIHSRLKGYTKQTKNEVKMNESEIAIVMSWNNIGTHQQIKTGLSWIIVLSQKWKVF